MHVTASQSTELYPAVSLPRTRTGAIEGRQTNPIKSQSSSCWSSTCVTPKAYEKRPVTAEFFGGVISGAIGRGCTQVYFARHLFGESSFANYASRRGDESRSVLETSGICGITGTDQGRFQFGTNLAAGCVFEPTIEWRHDRWNSFQFGR